MALFGAKKTDQKKVAQAPAKKDGAKKATVKNSEATSMQDLYGGEVATESKKGAAASSVSEKKNDISNSVLVRPLITEKATNLSAENKYVFVVSKNANKIEIAKAIKAIYGVKPIQVNLANVSGKKVARGKIKGQRSDWRKAIVTLAKGETIKIYEGV